MVITCCAKAVYTPAIENTKTISMNPQSIRAQRDRELFERLAQEPQVVEVNRQIERHEREGPLGTRRRLLATSVKLSEAMAPELSRIARECMEVLDVTLPTELYAYNSPQFNAACVKPEEGKLFIMFSSSLLDAFDEQELRFVMGHELGHFVFRHHDLPIGYLLRGQPPVGPQLALQLTSWSRFAEFSADRAGAVCVNNFEAVSRALFKLASGVTGSFVNFRLEDFLQQVDEMRYEDVEVGNQPAPQDWFMTHPFSPLRVKALQAFHRSELMQDAGVPAADLELGIEGLMALMEPSYLMARTEGDKAMRHMLFAGALAVANADGKISALEIEAFEKFFGENEYNDTLDIDRLTERLPVRAGHVVNSTSAPKRMQLVRDLCVMARAEGKTHPAALQQLREIAGLLQVPELFVEQSLSGQTELD